MRSSPYTLVLLSAVLWATQPTFILFMGQKAINASSILVLNTFATALVALLTALYTGAIPVLVDLLRRPGLALHFTRVLVLDGLLVAASYFFLFKSAETSNLASAAIFFEAWPIVALIYMYRFSPREGDRRSVVVASSMLFIVGFFLLNLSEHGTGGSLISLDLVYSSLSAVFFGVGVAIVQIFVRRNEEFSETGVFAGLVFVRALFTSIFVLALVYLSDDLSLETAWTGRDLLTSLGVGCLVFVAGVFYHTGMFEAKGNAVGLVVLVSPVLAPLFIFLLGLGTPQMLFFVGSAFIFAGISVTSRTEDNTPQFQMLLALILIAGSCIIFLEGAGSEDYFQYVQTLFIFYGILQVGLLTKCYEKFQLLNERGIEFAVARRARDNATARSLAKKIRFMLKDSSSLSELVLLSVIAVGGTVISIMSRDNSLLGDATAFLIAVSAAFLVLLCWYYQVLMLNFRLAAPISPAMRGGIRFRGRILSYMVSVSLFAWFLGLIVYKNSGAAPPVLP